VGSDPNYLFRSTRPHPRLPFERRPSYLAACVVVRAARATRLLARRTRAASYDEEADYDEGGTGSDCIDDGPHLYELFTYREDVYCQGLGFPKRCRGVMGYTGLHCAARQGHSEIVEMLLDHGANINSISAN